jgi:hypothetical protein
MSKTTLRETIRAELDRAIARVLLGAVDEAAELSGCAPNPTAAGRILVGPKKNQGELRRPPQEAPAGALNGLFARFGMSEVREAIAHLETRGLVERRPGRMVRLGLTPQGEQYLQGRIERPTGVLERLLLRPEHKDPAYLALRELRAKLARAEELSPAYLFPERTLRALAAKRPRTIDELRSVPGIGPGKAARYGAALLEAIAKLPPRALPSESPPGDADPWERVRERDLLLAGVGTGDAPGG